MKARRAAQEGSQVEDKNDKTSGADLLAAEEDEDVIF